MPDYTLHYWPVPFRGQFVRAVLAHAGPDWDERSAEDIAALMEADPADQPVPFLAPPMLEDRRTGVAVAQMPAILWHLGETLDLLPADPQARALTGKIIGDTNDVLEEITCNGGREMWTPESWAEYLPRLKRRMAIFEAAGIGQTTGLAELVTATLWFTMTDKLPRIGEILTAEAPRTAALSRRVMETPALAAMRARTDADYGDVYCGGQIEASLRKVLA